MHKFTGFTILSLFQQKGPMVPDVAPREASDRLIIYQNTFDTLHRKFITYTGGEELFGLSVSDLLVLS